MLARTHLWPTATGYRVLAVLDGADEVHGAYYVFRNVEQLQCPYCGTARFRLRSAARREPYFACEDCGQRLEM